MITSSWVCQTSLQCTYSFLFPFLAEPDLLTGILSLPVDALADGEKAIQVGFNWFVQSSLVLRDKSE